MHHFEGTEKILEMAVTRGDLRDLGEPYWQAVSAAAGARILSHIGNETTDAWLLSESSLLVSERRLLMITCGRTTLIKAALAVIERVGTENISFFSFERKTERFPASQPTTFSKDVIRLERILPGQTVLLGDENDPRVSAYYKVVQNERNDSRQTLQVLLHGCSSLTSDLFDGGTMSSDLCQQRHNVLQQLLPGWLLDEHQFRPRGYSCNALAGANLAALHVTPEETGRYVSFALSTDNLELNTPRICELTRLFQPARLELVVRQAGDVAWPAIEGYPLHLEGHHILDNGWTYALLTGKQA